MSFLEPFFRRKEIVIKQDVTDISNDEVKQQYENLVITDIQGNVDIIESEDNTPTSSIPKFKRPRSDFSLNQSPNEKKNDSASSVLKKYFDEMQKEEDSRVEFKDPTDIFFQSIAAKVRRFSPYYRNIAETRIFNLVQQLELEQLKQ